MSDRLTVGLISRLARASARRRAYRGPLRRTLRQPRDVRGHPMTEPPKRTQPPDQDNHEHPAPTAMRD